MVQTKQKYELNEEVFNNYIFKNIDDYTKRVEVYYGGAGSGKSYGVMQKVILKAMNEKRKVLVVRKVQRTLSDSVWDLANKLIKDAGMYQQTYINNTNYKMRLSNGSEFLFKGLDDSEKIKSITDITDIVIEEATELTMDDYTQLNLRLRPKENNPQIYLMFNPVSKANWVYKYFFADRNVKKDKNIRIVHSTYKDNKFLTEEYKEEIKKLELTNPAYYRIYVLGEFATLDKLVYPVYEKRIITKEEVKGLTRIQGLDFGYTNDPSALILGYYDEQNKRIYITEEYVKKGMLNDEIAAVMKSLEIHKDMTFADSAEQKSIAEISRLGVRIKPAVKGPDSIMQGIQWIQQHELIVDERCFKTIEELENYTWVKNRDGEYINRPVDTFNHTLDALRYALNDYIKGNQKVEIFNKQLLFRR